MIVGPALAILLSMQSTAAISQLPNRPSPPPAPLAEPTAPTVPVTPTLGTSAAVWCPSRGPCSQGVAIPIGTFHSLSGHGLGQAIALLGSHSAGVGVAHLFTSSPHLSVAIGVGAVVPYDQSAAGIRGGQGVIVGVLEVKP